jgi:DNA-binding XRE family transcriptional regulator
MPEEKKRGPGQPRKFQTVAELQAAIDGYFESCFAELPMRDKDGNVVLDAAGKPYIERLQVEPFTITGLALALDTSRETLMDIENGNWSYTEEYSDAISRAKLRCQNYAEKQMYTAKSANGPIFALKNYGWKDKQEIDTNATGSIEVVFSSDLEKWSK